jgi:hypothetical protein
MHDYKKEMATGVVREILAAGFRPFVAERGSHGFYTDAEGSRVVSFQCDLGMMKYSGNYVTSAPKQCGTGWQLETASYASMFSQVPFPGCVRQGVTWRYKTLKEYQADYQSSSRFAEVFAPASVEG